MTERLPTVGSDNNDWGTVLNAYLTARKGFVNAVADHGADNTGATDASTAINAAITAAKAADTGVFIPAGSYKLSATLTVDAWNLMVTGDEAMTTILVPDSGVSAITMTSNGTSFTQGATVKNLVIEGPSVRTANSRYGITCTAGDFGGKLYNIVLRQLENGLRLPGAQFWHLENVGAYSCYVGFRLYQDITAGGGNNNTWVTCNAQGNTVGLMAYNASPYPIHSNTFVDTAWHSNQLCGAYFFGCSLFQFTTPAHELNGTGSDATLTIYGHEIERSAWHLEASSVIADGLYGPAFAPQIVLEDGIYIIATATPSFLHIVNGGGGSPYVIPRDNSRLILDGLFVGANGTIQGVSNWGMIHPDNSFVATGSPELTYCESPNACPSPRMLGSSSGTGFYAGMGSSSGTEVVSGRGMLPYVTFAASIGDINTNRMVFDCASGSQFQNEYVVMNCLAMATSDCTLSFNFWREKQIDLTLEANQAIRITAFGTFGATARDNYCVVFPPDTAGAKLYLWNVHVMRFTDKWDPMIGAMVKYGWCNLGASAYSASNVSTDRTYDANATTTDELADVLGTLISDLRNRGIVS